MAPDKINNIASEKWIVVLNVEISYDYQAFHFYSPS
ncbi:hypothetical protein PP427_gp127 [Salmonella phage KM16]|nr:hypothetical protein PP427_gp127 [Salmonella phage KM16]